MISTLMIYKIKNTITPIGVEHDSGVFDSEAIFSCIDITTPTVDIYKIKPTC